MRSLSLATRRGQGGSLATRGMLFSTYCIRWPVHNKVSFDTMSCIVQSQQYLPVVGLLRQVERARVLHLDLQQSDGKAIPGPPPLGLKLLTQGGPHCRHLIMTPPDGGTAWCSIVFLCVRPF